MEDMPEVVLRRDCPALTVPWGSPETLAKGDVAVVAQRLGGSFTLRVAGNLYRVEGKDADALGYELPAVPQAAPTAATAEAVEAEAWARLATCYDPEIAIDIVELGLIYGLEVTPAAAGKFAIAVHMTVTAPGCGMGNVLAEEVREKLLGISGVAEVDVSLVFDPPWSYERMSEAARLESGFL